MFGERMRRLDELQYETRTYIIDPSQMDEIHDVVTVLYCMYSLDTQWPNS